MNTQTKKLGEVCEIEKERNNRRGLPFVGMEDIESNSAQYLGSRTPRDVKSSSFYFTGKHILYGRLRPYLNKVLLPNFEGHCSTEIFPIKVNNDLNKKYLFYWLTSDTVVKKVNATCTGTRMPRANMSEVLDFEIPLPPLPTQRRIVKKLDKIFASIEKAKRTTEKNLQNARELFESYLHGVFASPGKGWEEKKLGEIADIKGGKRVPKGYRLETTPTNYPYIRVADFNDNGSVDLENIRYINESVFKQINNYTISTNDLYISIAGTIGKTGIVPDELGGANLTENACKLIFKDNIYPKYVYYFTKTPDFLVQAGLNTRVAAMPKLALTRLSTISFKIPRSLPEQKRIVAKLDTLSVKTKKLEAIYKQKLADLDELKKSVLKKAFTGEL